MPVILVVVSGSLIGCDLGTLMNVAGNEGASVSNGEEGAGSAEMPGSDMGAGGDDSSGGEQPEPTTSEPSDTTAEDPPDSQSGEPPELSDDAVPDFAVVDVNADSLRHQEFVSPRDYLGQISAWYFGHST